MLSDRTIRALKEPNTMVSDGGGLYLRVSPTGTKTFVYRTKTAGKTRYATLGTYPTLSLVDARKRASEFQGKQIGVTTLNSAVEAFLSHLEGVYEHPEQVRQRLSKDITPNLGKRRLDSITSADLSDALQVITDRGSPVSANRTLADVKHVFNFAYEKGWVREDPSSRITRKVIGGREKSRDIVLTDDELKELIAELRSTRWEPKTRVGLALALLTGQRASEVLGIHGEVQGDWWTIPKERTKSKREHRVFLVPLARWLARQSESCDHRTLSRALNRAGKRYSPHDLRRTMATKLSDLGVMPHVIEKMLNHQMEGVMQVYNRADWLAERKAAWTLWYSYLRRILSPPTA